MAEEAHQHDTCYDLGYREGHLAGVAAHVEHHRCERCFAAGQAAGAARTGGREHDLAGFQQYGLQQFVNANRLAAQQQIANRLFVEWTADNERKTRAELNTRVAALTAALRKARAYVNAAQDNWARITLKVIDAALDAAGGAP